MLPHTVTFTVTNLTKVVDGVRSTVVWDVDAVDDEVSEAELAFFAQDAAGNVWNVGEYPEEYARHEFVGAPSTWVAGTAGAEPGIHMPATPAVGTPEYAPGLGAGDHVPRLRDHRRRRTPPCAHRSPATRTCS